MFIFKKNPTFITLFCGNDWCTIGCISIVIIKEIFSVVFILKTTKYNTAFLVSRMAHSSAVCIFTVSQKLGPVSLAYLQGDLQIKNWWRSHQHIWSSFPSPGPGWTEGKPLEAVSPHKQVTHWGSSTRPHGEEGGTATPHVQWLVANWFISFFNTTSAALHSWWRWQAGQKMELSDSLPPLFLEHAASPMNHTVVDPLLTRQ